MSQFVTKQEIEAVASGNWESVLLGAGVPGDLLNGKHQPCPCCGGTDRFRFLNKDGRGTWICNQCKPDGASPFDLVMAVYGCSFVESLDLLATTLGLSKQDNGVVVRKPKPLPEPVQKQPARDEWTPIVPVPEFALQSMSFGHFKYNNPVAKHLFKDANGAVLGAVVRFVRSDGSKIDLPYTFCENVRGEKMWRWRGWNNPRPLYGLDALAGDVSGTVLVVEGEKCKQAVVQAALPFVAVTWHGGCHNWDKSDWSAIQNRDVILWADADCKNGKDGKPLAWHEQGGMKAMLGVADLLQKQGCRVRLVDLPDVGALPDGFDVADALDNPQTWFNPCDLGDYLVDLDTVLLRIEGGKVAPMQQGKSVEKQPALPVDESGDDDNGDDGNLIRYLVQNYAQVGEKKRALNLVTGEELSYSQLAAIWSKEAVFAWSCAGGRRLLLEHQAKQLSARLRGVQMLKDNESGFSEAMNRYVFLDGTTDAYDINLKSVIPLNAVKAAIPFLFDSWNEAENRLICPIDKYVFDPSSPAGVSFYDDNGIKRVEKINIFEGFGFDIPQVQPYSADKSIDDMWRDNPKCR